MPASRNAALRADASSVRSIDLRAAVEVMVKWVGEGRFSTAISITKTHDKS